MPSRRPAPARLSYARHQRPPIRGRVRVHRVPGQPRRHQGPAGRVLRVVVAAVAIALASSVPGAPAGAAVTVVVLQMNLCNSGMAVNSCYSGGRAVDEAVEKIRRYAPDLVTLQEVCRDDLYARPGWGKLAGAMAAVHGGGPVSVDFVPARNRYTGRPYQCVNGEQYGVALVHHLDGRDQHRGWYRAQDLSDEIRAWTCTTLVDRRLTGCTTHLSTDRAVAMRQCRELMSILASPWVMPEVVVAGDFNLTAAPGEEYDVGRCAAGRFTVAGDGALQHAFFTSGLRRVQGWHETMKWTDHPLLYETFRLPPG